MYRLRQCTWRLTVVGLFVLAGRSYATPFTVPVDEGVSVIHVELCMLGECDSDSSGVAGALVIQLDAAVAPQMITVHDMDLALVDPIELHITIYFVGIPVGSFDVTSQNLSMHYATPGVPTGPVPIKDGAFTFVGVPIESRGMLAYDAGGTVCIALQAEGIPCQGEIDLITLGPQSGDLSGTVSVDKGVATLAFDPTLDIPFDPANPDLGTLAIAGTVTGSAAVPVKGDGDFDMDGDVDLGDFAGLQRCFGGVPPGDGCAALDFDGSGAIDLTDHASYNNAATGPL